MSRADTADILWVILCLVLVGSAVLSRRWSVRSALVTMLSWVMIFFVAILLFSYRAEIALMFDRVKSELVGRSQQQVRGGTVTVPMSADGHFWIEGEVNGARVRFLVDSGASLTALSEATATRAGLKTGGLPVAIRTANGAIQAERTTIDRMRIGPITADDLPAIVSPAFGDVNVVGMNFLSKLEGWRVEGKRLILDGGAPGREDEATPSRPPATP